MENNSKRLLLGISVGLGIGAALGLLLAPNKGSETYKRIEETVRNVTHDLRKFGKESAEMAKSTVGDNQHR